MAHPAHPGTTGLPTPDDWPDALDRLATVVNAGATIPKFEFAT